ncbi:signal recognition particle protein [Ceraceosorus bombacis]|uniref:signal-recognition-particle GTPase n=1 Tax=Ceraceosorus bombacis TaxID=401625 RepID=A0A0P1BCG4_9BASI|nr:signal recognition particle protein [Ceraceosorus bombacis]
MVLADLGRRINATLSDLNKTPLVDNAAIDALLKSVCSALLEADVNVRLVSQMRDSVKGSVKEQLNESGKAERLSEPQRRNVVQKAIFDHLVGLVDPGTELWAPKKGKQNVIMFVGLQGSGKTTSVTKLGSYYSKRGFKVGLVCADTFRAGAFDQLKQNASKAGIPFYGSYTETDPVTIAGAGVDSFKQGKFDVIIVDTSGRHRQETELFNEMVEIGQRVKPDQTIMVVDASIGQAAEAQARAFKEAADFGGIFVTKLDGHAKGGGAISAVAATKTPILFIGLGEHVGDLEVFKPQPFISKMLGMGDMTGLMEKVQEVQMANPDRQKEMLKKIEEGGTFSIRDWREQIGNIMKMGPLSKIAGMIPGLGQMMSGAGGDEEAGSKMKRMMFLTDSMTAQELDSDGSIFYSPVRPKRPPGVEKALEKPGESSANADGKKKSKEKVPVRMNARARRVAKGSGTSVREVEEFLMQYRMVRNLVKQMGGKQGWLKQMQGGGRGRGGAPPQLPPGMSRDKIMEMQNMLPPDVKAQLRQPGGRERLLQQLSSGQIPPGMENLPGMGGAGGGLGALGGMGGLGGMMQQMMGGGGGGPGGAGGMAGMQQMMQQMMGGMGGAGRGAPPRR